MIALLNILSVFFLFYSITTFPLDVEYTNNDTTMLLQIASESYGSSKNSSDSAVATWNITTSMIADETTGRSKTLTDVGLGRGGLAEKSRLWPNGIIPISIEGTYTADEREMLIRAMDTLDYWTCIRFTPYVGQNDYLAIINGRGCKSPQVGYSGGRQEIKLESPKCFSRIGKILHVMLHAIGLIDEHRRQDRDHFIYVHDANIMPGEETRFSIFHRYPTSDYYVPYDYNSVMHLPPKAYSKNGLKTIEPVVPGYRLGQRKGMSVRDAIKVANMYNCFYELDMTQNFSRILPIANETLFPKDVLMVLYFKGKMGRS